MFMPVFIYTFTVLPYFLFPFFYFFFCGRSNLFAKIFSPQFLIFISTEIMIRHDLYFFAMLKFFMQALEILKMLSGKTHRVITGCAIIRGEQKLTFSQTTEVEFYPLSDEEINAYVATGETTDKAGAYGIQGKGALLVKEIRGDYYNVVGLPVALLNRKLALLRAEQQG